MLPTITCSLSLQITTTKRWTLSLSPSCLALNWTSKIHEYASAFRWITNWQTLPKTIQKKIQQLFFRSISCRNLTCGTNSQYGKMWSARVACQSIAFDGNKNLLSYQAKALDPFHIFVVCLARNTFRSPHFCDTDFQRRFLFLICKKKFYLFFLENVHSLLT